MNKVNLRYWLCQILGWGIFGLIVIYFNLIVFKEQFDQHGGKMQFLVAVLIYITTGIFCTHLLKIVIKKSKWLKFSINKLILFFIVGIGVTGVVMFFCEDFIEKSMPFSFDNYIRNYKLDKAKKAETDAGLEKTPYFNSSTVKDSLELGAITEIKKKYGWYKNKSGVWKYEDNTQLYQTYQNIVLIALWLFAYLLYHYVQRNRRDQLDKLKLEATVKSLELKTIKSHINPHFIFNSLNSIRALVDENPQRARKSITELSNILRSSLKAEKAETVTLEHELDIVKDYLALEHMRFEERLKIEMEIDPETLEQPVPPMMLQTLVENAIKHGISKLVNGGIVKVITLFNNDYLELMVQNTGQLNGSINANGFGIKSTQDRLNLIYQGKAIFAIKNINCNTVESKVKLPITI